MDIHYGITDSHPKVSLGNIREQINVTIMQNHRSNAHINVDETIFPSASHIS